MQGRRALLAPLICSLFCSLLGVLGGSGCDASIDPIVVPDGCPNQPIRGPEQYAGVSDDLLIDDFEDGNEQLALVANRTGAWISVTNGSSDRLTVGTTSACSARGKFAGHFVGAGFTDHGANWSAVFEAYSGGLAVPLDGRAFSGISFWAASGPTVPEPFTQALGITTMDNVWNGGICKAACMDYYSTKVDLTRTWRRYVIRFADLQQAGFGDPQVPLRMDQLVGFIIWPKTEFDIWIDDVRFEPAE